MRAATIRIVGDKHIAGTHVGIVRHDSPDGFCHGPKVNRNVRRIDDQLPTRIEYGTTEIEPFLYINASGRFSQRDAHLLGNRGEVIIEDFQPRRVVGRIGIGFTRSCRFVLASLD